MKIRVPRKKITKQPSKRLQLQNDRIGQKAAGWEDEDVKESERCRVKDKGIGEEVCSLLG